MGNCLGAGDSSKGCGLEINQSIEYLSVNKQEEMHDKKLIKPEDSFKKSTLIRKSTIFIPPSPQTNIPHTLVQESFDINPILKRQKTSIDFHNMEGFDDKEVIYKDSNQCYELEDGSIYKGEFNVNFKPHGRGIIKFKDGSIHFGFFKNGYPEGEGRFLKNDGFLEEGKFAFLEKSKTFVLHGFGRKSSVIGVDIQAQFKYGKNTDGINQEQESDDSLKSSLSEEDNIDDDENNRIHGIDHRNIDGDPIYSTINHDHLIKGPFKSSDSIRNID
jgi:hypothetical protein